ncbi:hypothetical protein PQJ75_24610 [Rhodoplanes sp. TEM]|uniref:MarR family transcriptional regulator n=1 Tax=Rhodoplanes tepidamans TaxID=200616 RepID=A0ABT5JE46_RHOTP|nr:MULTISPECIES: hypothetical protein [Rhodoplanes]MDC7787950.1 hypothetical protein [Rhodoplanes tepidamans]MDC7986924.1 hypothetical protein [Rhodoplanes sp. TEM]MDQ0358379.1 hypothetical protein [Rhodoplanes tepidamans]
MDDADIRIELDKIAALGGTVETLETQYPIDRDVAAEAVRRGLIDTRLSGTFHALWSLTDAGRAMCGLPPQPKGLISRLIKAFREEFASPSMPPDAR